MPAPARPTTCTSSGWSRSAYMWAQMAKAAQDKLKAGANGSEERMKAKLVTGKFFMERMLPESAAHLKRIQTGADTMMALPAEAF